MPIQVVSSSAVLQHSNSSIFLILHKLELFLGRLKKKKKKSYETAWEQIKLSTETVPVVQLQTLENVQFCCRRATDSVDWCAMLCIRSWLLLQIENPFVIQNGMVLHDWILISLSACKFCWISPGGSPLYRSESESLASLSNTQCK